MDNLSIDKNVLAKKILKFKKRALKLSKGDVEAANDLIQDLYIKAHSKVHTLKNPKLLNKWLEKVLYRLHLDRYREKDIPTIDIDEICEDLEITVNNKGEDKIMYMDLSSEVNLLPLKLKKIFRYSLFGYSYEQIATKTRVPIGTVKSSINISKTIIKNKIKKNEKNI